MSWEWKWVKRIDARRLFGSLFLFCLDLGDRCVYISCCFYSVCLFHPFAFFRVSFVWLTDSLEKCSRTTIRNQNWEIPKLMRNARPSRRRLGAYRTESGRLCRHVNLGSSRILCLNLPDETDRICCLFGWGRRFSQGKLLDVWWHLYIKIDIFTCI